MKSLNITLVLVAFGLLGIVQSFPTNFEESDDPTIVWPIPQKNGDIRWMTEDEALLEASKTESKTRMDRGEKVRFFLFTKENPIEPVEIDMDDPKSLTLSNYNPQNPTRFMIHGWLTFLTEQPTIREALLLSGENRDFNYIAVDWSVYSHTGNYIIAKNDCSKAGKKVAEFIDWLHVNANQSFSSLAVYGHSLGAHVAGFTGKHVKQGQIHTIIGMDPAMPLFRFKNSKNRLAKTDAMYVETIQTNGGLLGFYNPIGQAAFYPNGGKYQKGCTDIPKGSCSHGRSIEYLGEALRLEDKNSFAAIGCKEFEHVKNATCNQFRMRSHLGDPKNAGRAKGIYYLETNSESPYGMEKRKNF